MIIPQASTEPPVPNGVGSRSIIGQDATGTWLAVETHRLGGGMIQSRAEAVQFVGCETGRRPDAHGISAAPSFST